jgi:nucleotide-binding universal stress UspA family protein
MGLPSSLIEAERRQRAWVEQETAGLRRDCEAKGVAFDARVDVGSLLDVLEDTATPDDILAIGATGRFRRGGVGSTTKALVRNAACPVLVVHAPSSGPASTDVTALACPFDATPRATEAIAAARRLAGATGLPLCVLAVARAGASATVQDSEALTSAARAAAVDATVVPLAPPAAGASGEANLVARYIRDHPGTLLVMGAYADSWIRELFLGSTTAQVLTALTGPVLLVHDRRGAVNPITADE